MRRLVLLSLPVAIAAAVLACGTDFVPASEVSSLRILGIRADPAEPRPGQSVTLQTLVVDPTRPDAGSATLWLGCAPSADTTNSPCSNTDALVALTSSGDGGGLPPGVTLLGLGPEVTTQIPTDVFGPDAGDLERQRGFLASAVVIVAAAPPPASPAEASALMEKIRNNEVPKQVALFRYPVSESTAPNHNPVLTGYRVEGTSVPPGATVRIPAPDASVDLNVPDASFEPYVEQTPTGPIDQIEQLSARYYATPQLVVDKEAVEVHGTVEELLGPGDAGLSTPAGHLWTVVRDSRGGQSWIDARTYLCDPSLPNPSATSAFSDGGILTVRGENLTQVLDVQVGPAVVLGASCDAQTCSGPLPALDAGSYPLVLRAKSCADVQTGISLPVP